MNDYSDFPYGLYMNPFFMSISVKNDIMFYVWSLDAFTFSIPSKIITMMISCGIIPAYYKKYL